MMRTCILVLTVGFAAALDSSETQILYDDYAPDKHSQSQPLLREGRSFDTNAGPLIRFGKRDPYSAPLIRFGRTPLGQPLIRFGKRSPHESPLIRLPSRLGRNPEASPLIRFGKRSYAAPLISSILTLLLCRFGRSPEVSPLIRFGKK
uniref:Uncharacterized protein n=1 Tax=Angiostrongylus cantonensis TaxID=6313 RepID=A0A0K0CXC0_ANGCA